MEALLRYCCCCCPEVVRRDRAYAARGRKSLCDHAACTPRRAPGAASAPSGVLHSPRADAPAPRSSSNKHAAHPVTADIYVEPAPSGSRSPLAGGADSAAASALLRAGQSSSSGRHGIADCECFRARHGAAMPSGWHCRLVREGRLGARMD
eukprot:scaffold6707_cov119-Isochrysis_galbana.AAC.4